MKNENIICVIQARTDSQRLPKKVLETISGKSLIWHMVNRLKHCSTFSQIVIATTNENNDKPLREFAKKNEIPFYAGKVDDIADRLYQTGKMFKASVLVKINGDSPLIDPFIVDEAVKKYLLESPRVDFVTNAAKRTFPEGMIYGIFNFTTLEKIHSELKDPFWRELVQMYIIENSKKYSVINIENKINLSHLKLDVDYPEDLQFVRTIYENLYKDGKIFSLCDIVQLLEKKPELLKINEKFSQLGLQSYNKMKEKHYKDNK